MKTILLYPFKLALSLVVICACIVWAIVTPDRFLKFWSAVYGIVDIVQGMKKDIGEVEMQKIIDEFGVSEKRMN